MEKYILYAPYGEPPPQEDWLLDMRLYGYTFHADPASMLLKELKLDRHGLRPYLKDRKAFFRSQDRLNRLKKWTTAGDCEDDIDRKMLAVIVRADQPEPFPVVMNLLAAFCRDGKFRADESCKARKEIESFGLQSAFWKMLAQTFGYVKTDATSITDFLIRVFVTEFSMGLKADMPAGLSHFLITGESHANNCAVFLAQWRTHMTHFTHYSTIEKYISGKLKIDEAIKKRLDGYWTSASASEDHSRENRYEVA